MVEFKNEMKDFKDEMRADRKRQNEKWGELYFTLLETALF